MTKKNDLVVVYAGNPVEAGFAKGLLEDGGIRAFLKDEAMGTWAPWYVSPGGAGAVKVVVAADDINRAKVILQDFLKTKQRKEN